MSKSYELDCGIKVFLFANQSTTTSNIDKSTSTSSLNNESESVNLRLVVRVGSLHERVDIGESGAAHFIEHLGFRATRNHDHGELIKMVQSFGSVFGADLNASTNLSHTLYKLDVKPSCVDPALEILADWAHGIRFLPSDVEAERKVIEEEYLNKRGASQRVREYYWSSIFPEYAKHVPIGTLEFIRSVTAEELEAFYRKKYVNSEMAVVIVTDDIQQLGGEEELLIKLNKIFSESSNQQHLQQCQSSSTNAESNESNKHFERLVQVYSDSNVADNSGPKSVILSDPELSSSHVCELQFFNRITIDGKDDENKHKFIRREIVKRVFISVLEQRLRLLINADGHSNGVLGAGVSSRLFFHVPPTECTTIACTIQPDRAQDALSLIVEELRSNILLNGFHDSEVRLAKIKWTHSLQKIAKQTLSCSRIADELVEHFLLFEATPLPDLQKETEYSLLLLGDDSNQSIQPSELLDFAKQLIDFNNSVVVLQTPDTKLTESDLQSIVTEVFSSSHINREDSNSTPKSGLNEIPIFSLQELSMKLNEHVSVTIPDILCTKSISSSKDYPVSTKYLPDIDAHLFILQNGIEVFCKRTTLTPSISFQAFQLCGASELNNIQDAAYSLLSDSVHDSGLGSLSGTELSFVESQNDCRLFVQRHLFHRGLGGSAPGKSLELLLRMIVSLLSRNVELDRKAFDKIKGNAIERLSIKDQSPEWELGQQVVKLFMGEDEPLIKPLTTEIVEQITFDMMQNLFEFAFQRSATKFTFVFCGAIPDTIQVEELGLLLESTLGRIKDRTDTNAETMNQNELLSLSAMKLPRSLGTTFPETPKKVVFSCGASGNSTVLMGFKTLFQSHPEYVNMYKKHYPSQMHIKVEDFIRYEMGIKIFCQFLRSRLLQVLRNNKEDNQFVYSVNVDLQKNTLSSQGIVYISFSCKPKNVDVIISMIENELNSNKLAPSEHELSVIHSQQVKWFQNANKNNSHILFWILEGCQRYKIEEAIELEKLYSSSKRDQYSDIGSIVNRVTSQYIQFEQLLQSCLEKEFLFSFVSKSVFTNGSILVMNPTSLGEDIASTEEGDVGTASEEAQSQSKL